MTAEAGDNELRKVEIGDGFTVCPECDYDKGFHSIFVPARGKGGTYDWFFICPSCGTHYDLGLKAHSD